MQSLLEEMQQCKSVKDCVELALTDAYGGYTQATAWLACLEEMFGQFERVNLLGEEVTLQGFDLENELTVVAPCGKGKWRAGLRWAQRALRRLSASSRLVCFGPATIGRTSSQGLHGRAAPTR